MALGETDCSQRITATHEASGIEDVLLQLGSERYTICFSC
jgi:hypothetical protein